MYDLCLALIGPDPNFREGLWTWGLICQRNFNTFEASKHPIYKKMSELYTFLKMPPTYHIVIDYKGMMVKIPVLNICFGLYKVD